MTTLPGAPPPEGERLQFRLPPDSARVGDGLVREAAHSTC